VTAQLRMRPLSVDVRIPITPSSRYRAGRAGCASVATRGLPGSAVFHTAVARQPSSMTRHRIVEPAPTGPAGPVLERRRDRPPGGRGRFGLPIGPAPPGWTGDPRPARTAQALPVARLRIAHFDGPGGSQTPRPVGDADRLGPVRPAVQPGPTEWSPSATATNFVTEFGRPARPAGRVPLGIVHAAAPRSSPWTSPGTSPRPGARRRDRGDQAGPRLQHPALDPGGERVGATVRWAEFDPGDRRAGPRRASPSWSARTRLVAVDRGVQPARHDAAGRGDRRARTRPTAHCSTWTACTTRRTTGGRGSARRGLLRLLAVQVHGPHCGVLAADPALLETLRPDKLLPSTMRCRSGSSWAPCPTSSSPG